jgi:hypothetical protein
VAATLSLYDAAAIGALALLIAIAWATSSAYAISNDEPVQQHYGTLIIAYYGSGFADHAMFHYQNLYLYGGLFDVLATRLIRICNGRRIGQRPTCSSRLRI